MPPSCQDAGGASTLPPVARTIPKYEDGDLNDSYQGAFA